MTVTDLRCDACGALLAGPGGEVTEGPFGVRFVYHPGDPRLSDDSGLLCRDCWTGLVQRYGGAKPLNRCVVCGIPVARFTSLHLRGAGEATEWQLCIPHGVEFLNGLRTVEPKLDPETVQFPGPLPEEPPA